MLGVLEGKTVGDIDISRDAVEREFPNTKQPHGEMMRALRAALDAEAAVAAYHADHAAFVLRCLHPASPLGAVTLAEWLHRETLDIVTGEPLFDDAHIDVTAGEVRRRLAALAPFARKGEL
jgi:hypothetical protein